MKFISWNVNGLRACVKKGFAEAFTAFDADFVCLQETKLQQGQLDIPFLGYSAYWNYAEKKGYSGTVIFTRHTPINIVYGIGIADLDHEGRLITLEYDTFFLVNCYTPNAQDGLRRLDFRLTWEDALYPYLRSLDAVKPVIFCGDLNVAHEEIDLKNPKTNRNNPGFSDEERTMMSRLLGHGFAIDRVATPCGGFTDTFRHLHPNDVKYSWWSYRNSAREKNIGWRIDYFVVSNSIKDDIAHADILDSVLGSDHCPVTLTVNNL